MRRLKPLAILALFALPALTASAQTLNTFTDGQPAVAAQVNQNFTLLLNEINALKAQVAALQPLPLAQAVVGTWDIVAIDSTTFSGAPAPSHNFHFESGGNKTVLTLNSNGTFSASSTGRRHSLEVFVISEPVLLPAPAGSTAPNGGVAVKSRVYHGLFNNAPDNASFSGTYTVSGNILVLHVGTDSLSLNASKNGEVLTLYQTGDGENTIAVGIKR